MTWSVDIPVPQKIEPPSRLRQLDGLTNHITKGQDAELRLEVVTIFYFSPLGVKIPNKALKTVNKFITIAIIFVEKAFNHAYLCVLSL